MAFLDEIRSKIIQSRELERLAADLEAAGKRAVFTNGCFDILHRGHIEYLATAATLADRFIIGLNSDDSVRRLKGPSRPAVDEASRALTLAAFGFVDHVVLFPEENPVNLLRALRPAIWVKGGDYQHIETLPEYKAVKAYGGEVVLLPFIAGFSTSDIFKKIRESSGE